MINNEQVLLWIILALTTSFSVGLVAWKVKTPATQTNWKWSNDWEQPSKAPDRVEEAPILPGPPIQLQQKKSQLAAALARAKMENKQVVIFFTNKSCSWCQRMKQEVLPTSEVKTALTRFIFIEIDIDKDQKTADQWDVTALPTHLVVTAEEKKIKSKVGWMSAGDYVSWLK